MPAVTIPSFRPIRVVVVGRRHFSVFSWQNIDKVSFKTKIRRAHFTTTCAIEEVDFL